MIDADIGVRGPPPAGHLSTSRSTGSVCSLRPSVEHANSSRQVSGNGSRRHDCVDRPLQVDHVQLAGVVLAERRDAQVGVEQDGRLAAGQAEDLAGAEVAVDVGAVERRDAAARDRRSRR